MQFPERKFLALKAQSAHNTDEIPGILHRAAQVIYLYRFVLDDTSWCAFIGDLKKIYILTIGVNRGKPIFM